MRYAWYRISSVKIFAITFLLILGMMTIEPRRADAVTPTPNATMTDVNSSDAYPVGNGAGIIEALGMIGSCAYYPYTQSNVASTAISWIKAGHNTIVEVTPQTGCDSSYSAYETAMSNVYSSIKSHVSTSAFNRYFGGFMIDEEPYSNYWYIGSTTADLSTTATQLGDINFYCFYYLDGASLGPYSELANAGGWWTQAEYNNVAYAAGLSVPAPQIYNTVMAGFQNSLESTYSVPTLVTCHDAYLTCSTAESDVHGYSFSYTTWGSVYWRNIWNSA